MIKKMLFAGTAVLASTIAAMPASAAMLVQYYTVTANGRDFQGNQALGTVNNGVENTLSNGRPKVTAANPLGAQDYNANRELLWWTPTTSSTLNVVSTGSAIINSNSFQDDTFFPANGAGTSNTNGFQTAIFSGSFTLATAQSVAFSIGSDDDAFLFIDGISAVQNGGVHGINTTTSNISLGAGAHSFQLFYADRRQTQAQINFSLPAGITVTPGVPEPATWAMMLVGFGMVGATARRRRAATKVTYA